MPLNAARLNERKENALAKAQTMINYALNREKCRSLIIKHTFDEDNFETCGVCDSCLKNRRQNEISDEKLREAVITALTEKPMNAKQIVMRINVAYENRLIPLLRVMQEKRVIFRGEDGVFSLHEISSKC